MGSDKMFVGVLLSLSLFISTSHSEKDCGLVEPSDGRFLLCGKQLETVTVGKNTSLFLYTSHTDNTSYDEITLELKINHPEIVNSSIRVFTISVPGNITLHFKANGVGHAEISFNYSNINDSMDSPIQSIGDVVREVGVIHSNPLHIIIIIIGWAYFAAWSISFYPQIILNFYRRSVVGLNFDFLALNLTGFIAYSAFNIGLFWIPEIKHEYFVKHPGSVNQVQLNDVIFAIHALAATIFTIIQCIIFEKNKQRVSYTAWFILVVLWLFVIISLIVAIADNRKLSWLEFLLFFSYVKLVITLIKYVPQAFMNFKRKSTDGWSIGNVLLDFTGGALSILQMILVSYNYNDWKSIFGDPTKFGLGAFSICFDIVFMVQHYILYRHPPKTNDGYLKIDSWEKQPLLGGKIKTEFSINSILDKFRNKNNDNL